MLNRCNETMGVDEWTMRKVQGVVVGVYLMKTLHGVIVHCGYVFV